MKTRFRLIGLVCVMVLLCGCNDVTVGIRGAEKTVTAGYFEGTAQESDYVNVLQNWWGALPSVNERLPVEPLQVTGSGKFGGRLNLPLRLYTPSQLLSGNVYAYTESGKMLNEPVLEWDGQSLTPNLFTQYECSEDGRTYTFTLREGVRWSDGKPVTARDVQFALEDVWDFLPRQALNNNAKNKETDRLQVWSPVWNFEGKQEGELPKFKQITPFQFTVTYTRPDTGLIMRMAYADNGFMDILIPFHYYSPFHPRYTGSEKKAMAVLLQNGLFEEPPPDEPERYPSWRYVFGVFLFERSLLFTHYPMNIPTLSAWVSMSADDSGTGNTNTADQRMIVRNPYYWKIDAEGRQLPYIDELYYYSNIGMSGTKGYYNTDFNTTIADVMYTEQAKHWAWLETRNWAWGSALFPIMLPEWREEKARIPDRVYLDNITTGAGLGLVFEYNGTDEKWNAAVRDTRFRQALSMALDRQKLLAKLDCDAIPATLAPEYDIQTAKQLLAESGQNPTIRLQQIRQLVLPGDYELVVLEWMAECWQALGLDVRLDRKTLDFDSESYVSVAWVPEECEYGLNDVTLPNEWELWLLFDNGTNPPPEVQELMTARDGWRNLGQGYERYLETVRETQCFLPVLEKVITPASVMEGLSGVTGKTLPEIWQGVEGWYWDK